MFCRLWAQYKIIDGLFENVSKQMKGICDRDACWSRCSQVLADKKKVGFFMHVDKLFSSSGCRSIGSKRFAILISPELQHLMEAELSVVDCGFVNTPIHSLCRLFKFSFTPSMLQQALSTRLSIHSLPTHAFIVMVSNQLIYPIVSLVKCSAFNLLLLISRSSIRVIEREREGEKVGER